MILVVCERVENTVEKGEMLLTALFPLTTMFSTSFFNSLLLNSIFFCKMLLLFIQQDIILSNKMFSPYTLVFFLVGYDVYSQKTSFIKS